MAGENIGRYNVILEFISDQKKLNDTLTNVDKKVTGFEASFKRAKVAFGAMISVAALQQIGSAIFDVTKKYQQYETILRVALGSQNKAEKALKLIQDTAKNTVFGVDELTSSYIKFVNRGINPTQAEIIKIADLAASQGKSFDQLTEAILDAQTGEFERLKEFGIKASQEGNKVSLSFRGMNQTIEKTPEAINAAIVSMGALNGIAGSNQAQMKNLSGIISNLGDTFDQLFKAIGDRFSTAIGAVLSGFSSLVGVVTDFMAIPLEQKLINEQNELNLLVAQITEANISQDERNKLINKLQAEYPNFLENLDAEKVSNGQLAMRLQEANNQYILRIALAKQQQKLDAAAEKLADAQLRQVDKNRQNLKILTDLDKKYKLGIDFTNKSLEERRKLVTEGLFAAQRRGVNIGLDNALASGIDVFGNVENNANELQNIFNNVKNDTEEIKKELQSILKVGDFTGFVEAEAEGVEKGTKSLSDKAKNAAAKIKTELEKLNEEQKILQDKIANDLLKKLPVDDKAVSRINEIKVQIENLNFAIDGLFNRGVNDSPLKQLTNQFTELIDKIYSKPKTTSILDDIAKDLKVLDLSQFDAKTIEKALAFTGGLSDEQQKDIAKNMTESLNKAMAIVRGEFNNADSDKDKPFLQTLLGISDEDYVTLGPELGKALNSVEQSYKHAMDSVFNYELAMNQKRIDLQKTRVDEASKLAEKGKVEQLKIEEERLNELEKKQRAFAQAQRAIAAIEIATATGVAIANGIQAVTNGFKTGGPAGLALGIANSLALAATIGSAVISIKGALGGIQGFKHGSENILGPGGRKSDSIPAFLSKHERVVDANNNEKIGFDFPNNKLPEAVALYKMFPSLLPHLTKSQPSEKINLDPITKRLEGIENFIQGLEVNVKLDSDGFATEIKRKFDSYDLVKRVVG